MLTLRASPSGLLRGEFFDCLGHECSIQESSEASEDRLWLGVEKNLDGELVSRMQLTRDQAQQLIPLLRSFVSTGSIQEGSQDAYRVGTWVKGAVRATEGLEGRVVSTTPLGVIIQDNYTSGVEGQYECSWESLNVLWEPTDKPDHLMSRFERIRSGDI